MDTIATNDPGTLIEELAARAAVAGRTWLPDLEVLEVRPLTGGFSSLTFTADITSPAGPDQLVLKVAPPGLTPVRNRDVLRQGRVMQALQHSPGVKVPAVRFADPGAPPEISPFVAMEVVPGECVEPLLDEHCPRDNQGQVQTRALVLDAARMLGKLHRVVPSDVGLGDEPTVSLRDEIDRWSRAFETTPPDLQGEYRACAKALHDTMPAAERPVINHGDYRLGNTLCEGTAVQAIIDWEIWSIGDPRVDLTWLTYFTDEGNHPAAPPRRELSGTPSVAEVVREYESAFGAAVTDIDWFNALTRYKEAAATALLIKRARKNGSMNAPFKRMEPALPSLLADARTLTGA